VSRAKLSEREGRIAVVLDVPMRECPACGERCMAWPVARALDTTLSALLRSGDQFTVARFAEPSIDRRP